MGLAADAYATRDLVFTGGVMKMLRMAGRSWRSEGEVFGRPGLAWESQADGLGGVAGRNMSVVIVSFCLSETKLVLISSPELAIATCDWRNWREREPSPAQAVIYMAKHCRQSTVT